ncbi:helix-turn-helix domain-containing protein [Sagittula sp. NFXS13]
MLQMKVTPSDNSDRLLPRWVPDEVRLYMEHTEFGRSIRELARQSAQYPSTISRQVRKIESRRDDPLVDAALCNLGAAGDWNLASTTRKDDELMTAAVNMPALPDEITLTREARRILRRLCEPGAILAVAAEMEKAVVVRDTGDGGSARTAVTDMSIAQAMALREWITCDRPARISQYRITSGGRSALNQMVAQQENRVRGFAEAQAGFDNGRAAEAALDEVDRDPRVRKGRYLLAESPLTALGRRRDRDGQPFLTEELISAGERLREDFELAQIGPRTTQNWDQFLTSGITTSLYCGEDGATEAQKRLQLALRDLGAGLGDVALRCCCYLEGLETAEKQLGWSARSGKIVLRIALQRLRRHYEERGRVGGDLIA